MNSGFLLGFFVSIILAIVVYLIISKVTGNKKLKGDVFDERQEQARGKAYKYGFYAMLLGLLVLMIITEFDLKVPLSPGLMAFIVALIGVDVYAVYSIMNDAYFGLNTKWRAYLIVIIAVTACNIAGGIYQISDFIREGGQVLDLTGGANICVAITFIPLLISMIAKKLSERREENEES